MRRCLFLVAFALFCAPCPLHAQPARTHDVTIDDYFTLSVLTASRIAPDGKLVAYSEGRWQQSTGDRKSDFWLVNTSSGKPRRLTFDRSNPRDYAWTADSKALYFLANRKRDGDKGPPYDGKAQVWRYDIGSGELERLLQVFFFQ